LRRGKVCLGALAGAVSLSTWSLRCCDICRLAFRGERSDGYPAARALLVAMRATERAGTRASKPSFFS
jgi:hypothetical protein